MFIGVMISNIHTCFFNPKFISSVNHTFILRTYFFNLSFLIPGLACPSFCNYIKSPLTWVDTFAVSPFYVELFFPDNSDQFAGLRVLRVAR